MPRAGIIGGGQLGQMLGEAGRKLEVECRFLDPGEAPPAATAGPVTRAAFDDVDALRALATDVDVLTYEFENVPVDALAALPAGAAVWPPPAALREAQDRVAEKRLFETLDIPLPRWAAIDGEADLERAAADIGLPLVVKTRRFGYDGKGQYLLERADDIPTALAQLPPRPLIAEQWVGFEREVSAIGVRGRDGEKRYYPLTENCHRGGILRTSVAPSGPEALAELANGYLERLLDHLDYVGVLALELFVADGRLLANEFAPRVHNSGHWTIEGARTSQFENHLRAVMGMPLGATDARGHAGMVNLIGSMPGSPDSLRDSGAFLHDYGKAPRPGRKLGHVTVVCEDAGQRDRQVRRLDAMLSS